MSRPGADPLDRFTAVFGLAFGALVWLMAGRTTTGLLVVGLNTVLGIIALWLPPRLRASTRPVAGWFGVTLPLLIFFVFYRETALPLGRPDIEWHDASLARAERGLSASVPTAGGSWLGPWLGIAYMLYVPFLVIATLLLFRITSRSRAAPAERTIRSVCVAWALCYVLFLAYPVLGPRQLTPGLQIERLGRGSVEHLALAYQNTLLLMGAAFPSAHVAATVAALLGIWTWRRAFFWAAALLGINIILATVYLGYHYVLDVGAGALIGAIAFRLDGWTTAPDPDVRS